MSAIIGMTAIGKSASDNERKDYSFSKIEDASNHLLGVINDILDMSKIEAGKFDFSTEEFNFERMLQRVMSVVNYKIVEKRQKIKVFVDRSIPEYLIGDDQRLAQVITNLVGNAVKFTPEDGSIRIGTYFLEEKDDVCSIKITVTDTGIGISPEQQTRLFKSFQQAESSTSRRFGGTGLGLAISKNIVEMMGGQIWVESELDKGATFSFTVKLERAIVDDRFLLGFGADWDNVRILVADDDSDTLAFFKKITGEFGASCVTAQTANEAIRLFKESGNVDICFVGWELPDMSGLDFIREIKELSNNGKTVTVAMFFDANKFDKAEIELGRAGVDVFVDKPFFPSHIVNTINDILGVFIEQSEESTVIKTEFPGFRLLLAEDVQINAEIFKVLLEPTLLEIDCAENGIEAVRMFSESPDRYDMIFMDLQMPEMDGLEATKSIRALGYEKAINVPIIALSANVFAEDVRNCLKAGMNDHIGKPVDYNAVIEMLKRYLISPTPE